MDWYSTVQVLYGVPSFLLMIIFWVLFAVLYGTPSVLLMIIFFVMFAAGKTFRHPFYRLLQFDLIVNITCYINSWFGIRFIEWGIGVKVLIWTERFLPGFLTLSIFLLPWYFHIQCASSILLCIYRFTAVMFLHAEEIWERYYHLAIVTSVLYSVIVMSPIILIGFAGEITLQNGTLHTEYNMDTVDLIYSMNPFFAIFYFVIITTSGVVTVVFIEKSFQSVNAKSKVTKAFIRKMTVVTVINSIMVTGNLLFITTGIMMAFKVQVLSVSVLNVFMSFTSDMMTLAMPYILLGNDYKVQTVLKMRKTAVTVHHVF